VAKAGARALLAEDTTKPLTWFEQKPLPGPVEAGTARNVEGGKEEASQHMNELEKDGTREELGGKGQKVKGRIKEAAGNLTGREDWEAEGEADQAEGTIREKVGEAGRKIGQAADRVEDELTGKDD